MIKDLKCVKIPLEIDPRTGDLAMENGSNCVKGQILSVLSTEPGERVMQPLLGLRQQALGVLAPVVTTSDVEDQLQAWITSEAACSVSYDKDPGKFEEGVLDIEVSYSDGEVRENFRLSITDGVIGG